MICKSTLPLHAWSSAFPNEPLSQCWQEKPVVFDWHPRHSPVLRHLSVLLLHWHGRHVRPTVFSGHSHSPVVTSQTLFGPLQPHATNKEKLIDEVIDMIIDIYRFQFRFSFFTRIIFSYVNMVLYSLSWLLTVWENNVSIILPSCPFFI